MDIHEYTYPVAVFILRDECPLVTHQCMYISCDNMLYVSQACANESSEGMNQCRSYFEGLSYSFTRQGSVVRPPYIITRTTPYRKITGCPFSYVYSSLICLNAFKQCWHGCCLSLHRFEAVSYCAGRRSGSWIIVSRLRSDKLPGTMSVSSKIKELG
jgi:hypothetical protein